MEMKIPESVKPTYDAAVKHIETSYKKAKGLEEYLTLALELDAFVDGVVLTLNQVLGGDYGIGKQLKGINVLLNLEKCEKLMR